MLHHSPHWTKITVPAQDRRASKRKLVRRQASLLRLIWVKEEIEERPLYEKWNSFSRIKVGGDPNLPRKPGGGGISSTYSSDQTIKKVQLSIDANAATDITAFNGDLSKHEYLKYDIVNKSYCSFSTCSDILESNTCCSHTSRYTHNKSIMLETRLRLIQSWYNIRDIRWSRSHRAECFESANLMRQAKLSFVAHAYSAGRGCFQS